MRKEVEDLFAGWPEPVAHHPGHARNAIRLIAVHDLEPLHTWSRANVLLVGDAAHAPLPTSGQGACQALEDAWHLARCLDGASGGLDDVFQAFANIRASKTARLAEQGRVFARGLFATDPETCRIRNERAKASDPMHDVQVLAAGWGQGLPMPGCTDGTPAQERHRQPVPH
jgi:2-polyprenyl-6-methoxyphenol hydroxylase-like FAD-dependent oxidoreductase